MPGALLAGVFEGHIAEEATQVQQLHEQCRGQDWALGFGYRCNNSADPRPGSGMWPAVNHVTLMGLADRNYTAEAWTGEYTLRCTRWNVCASSAPQFTNEVRARARACVSVLLLAQSLSAILCTFSRQCIHNTGSASGRLPTLWTVQGAGDTQAGQGIGHGLSQHCARTGMPGRWSRFRSLLGCASHQTGWRYALQCALNTCRFDFSSVERDCADFCLSVRPPVCLCATVKTVGCFRSPPELGPFHYEAPLVSIRFDGQRTYSGQYRPSSTAMWTLRFDLSNVASARNCKLVHATVFADDTSPNQVLQKSQGLSGLPLLLSLQHPVQSLQFQVSLQQCDDS